MFSKLFGSKHNQHIEGCGDGFYNIDVVEFNNQPISTPIEVPWRTENASIYASPDVIASKIMQAELEEKKRQQKTNKTKEERILSEPLELNDMSINDGFVMVPHPDYNPEYIEKMLDDCFDL